MWATEWFLKWEVKTLVDKLRDKEEEIKKLKDGLENRVAELERIVRELIQWKEDRRIIQLDKNWKEIWLAIHNYHMEETYENDTDKTTNM